jgi:poly(A) polymerase
LLIRYRRSEGGKLLAKAVVYTKAEHGIERSGIDPDALRIVERLRENGHEAYIVGGAVRDLLLGRRPKDFDIVTDAQPSRIKRVFRSARVIGRRFRLVHVYAGPKIFEVSTFRSIANGTIGNEFGTIDEDAHRRDFTLNALYYDPYDSTLVDYVGGFKDIAARKIEPVIPLKSIFREDAVRMIRCVKYAATAGFRIPFKLRFALRRDSALLGEASPSRLTEEFLKILGSGSSAKILEGLSKYNLLRHILPQCAALTAVSPAFAASLKQALAELDERAMDPVREKTLSVLLAHYLKPFLEHLPDRLVDTPDAYREAVHEARLFLSPLNPPRVELEAAVLVVFKKRGISPTQRPRKWASERGEPRGGEPMRKDAPRRGGQSRAAAPKEEKPAMEPAANAASGEEGAARGDSPAAKRRRRRNRSRHNQQGGQPPRDPSGA